MRSLYKALIGSAITLITVSSVILTRYGAGDKGKYVGEPETDIRGIEDVEELNCKGRDLIARADRVIEKIAEVNEIMERNTNELISRLNKNRDEIFPD